MRLLNQVASDILIKNRDGEEILNYIENHIHDYYLLDDIHRFFAIWGKLTQ